MAKVSSRVPGWVLTAVAVPTRLLASAVLAVIALALMPGLLAIARFVAVVVTLVVLTTGRAEAAAVQLLARARPGDATELATLAPVLARLEGLGIPVGRVYVRRSRQAAVPAARLGRAALVVSPWLVDSTDRGVIGVDDAAALVAHAVGRRHAASPWCELAARMLLLPWRAVAATAAVAGAAMGWFPLVRLVRLAWMLRGVVGAVCVAQSAAQGRAWAGALAGVLVLLTYLVPMADRERASRAEAGADRYVVDHGLGGVLGALLGRLGQPVTLERRERLGAAEAPRARGHLRLVPSP